VLEDHLQKRKKDQIVHYRVFFKQITKRLRSDPCLLMTLLYNPLTSTFGRE